MAGFPLEIKGLGAEGGARMFVPIAQKGTYN